MKNLLNFKSIRTKMIFGFSFVLLLVVFLAVFNYLVLNKVNKTTENVLDKEIPLLIADEQLISSMYNSMGVVRAYVMSGEGEYKDIFTRETEQMELSTDVVMELAPSEEFQTIIQHTEEWRDFVIKDIFYEYDRGRTERAYENVLTADGFIGELVDGYKEFAINREAHIIELEEGILAEGKTTIMIVVIVSAFVVLLGLTIAFVTSYSISNPLLRVMKRMHLIAEGDLSGEPLKTNLRDEIGQLVASTNEMNHTTRSLLAEISSVSKTVRHQSDELTQSADEVRAGTEQISITMEELATGSESQADHASDLSEAMGSFTTKIDETSQDGEQIQDASNQVLHLTDEGRTLMQDSTNQMGTIEQIVHDAVGKVEGLDNQSQKISELVLVIQEIAEQTNLLALNAAIEAARAGEHGQGFAVVADEVRKLAEQSSTSVMSITDIVNNIQSESSAVAESLRDSYKDVEAGTNQITETGQTFAEISTAVTEMGKNIKRVSENLIEISKTGQRMNGSIQEIAAVSEESAAGVEETTASSEQTSSAMEEVAGNSNELAKLAEALNQLVQRFKL